MNTANFKNSNNKYPLSTDTLDFMQKQIHLAYGLASLYGDNYIITQSTADTDGLIVLKGELMPLKGTANKCIAVKEISHDIEAGGQKFANARVERYAYYTTARVNAYLASNFPIVDGIGKHLVPKGVINMWSGAVGQIPTGWRLCDGTNGTPDLSGRFIVGYQSGSTDYGTIGQTGGEATHKLLPSEMPAHTHSATVAAAGAHNHILSMNYRGNDGNNHNNGTTIICSCEAKTGSDSRGTSISSAGAHAHTVTIGTTGNAKPHENRPPYYVLAYIMKVI